MISSGRTAVVVGGGTGIGAGCAIGLAEDGFRVAIGGRRNDKLKEVAARFDGEPGIITHAGKKNKTLMHIKSTYDETFTRAKQFFKTNNEQ